MPLAGAARDGANGMRRGAPLLESNSLPKKRRNR